MKMTAQDELMKLDLYEILGVLSTATEKEISKAYRKAALKCHPDKNPDRKAHEEFKRLGKILELLCDATKRAIYDQRWKAKKAAAERIRQLDSKRRKLRDDLEKRERAHAEKQTTGVVSSQEKVEKLREEGYRLVQQGFNPHAASRQLSCHIKVKWEPAPGYSEAELSVIFRKYGTIKIILLIDNCSAIVEFTDRDSALHSMRELGNIENPLELDLLDMSEVPQDLQPSPDILKKHETASPLKRPSAPVFDNDSFDDLEAATLQKLMAAAAAQQKKKEADS